MERVYWRVRIRMRHGVHQDKKCQDTGQKANPTNFQRDHRSHPGKRMQPDFSKIMLKIIGQRNKIFTCLKKIIFKPRILHSTNLSFRCEGKIKIVSHLQEISKILSPRTLSLSLSQKTTRRWALPGWGNKPTKRKRWNPGNRWPITGEEERVFQGVGQRQPQTTTEQQAQKATRPYCSRKTESSRKNAAQ